MKKHKPTPVAVSDNPAAPQQWTYRATPESEFFDFAVKVGADHIGVYTETQARLIAAAPDLLDALKELFGAEMEKCMRWDGKADQLGAIRKARAAIAKAEGA